jgi:alpha/beta superfamily hydrolase
MDDQTALASIKKPVKPLVPATAKLPDGYTRPVSSGKGLLSQLVAKVMPDQTAEAEENVFGKKTERQTIKPETKMELDLLHATGAAAPLEITSSKGGHKLKGNFYSAKGSNLKDSDGKPDLTKPVVLLLTGSGGSAEDQGLEMAKFYRETGASCMSVNYRGYGSSDDQPPSEQGLVEDAQDMFEHLLKMGYQPDQIIIHGFSMGGAVAGLLEKNNAKANPNMKLKGAVYDRAMTSTYDAARDEVNPVLAKGAEVAVGFKDTKGAIKKSDKSTPRVVATDADFLGPSGDKMRKDLQKKKGAQVEGASSGSKHMDHQAMLGANEEALTNLLHPDGFTPDTQEDEFDAAVRVARPVIDKVKDLAGKSTDWTATLKNWKTNPPKPTVFKGMVKSLAGSVKQAKQDLAALDLELVKSLNVEQDVIVVRNNLPRIEKEVSEIEQTLERTEHLAELEEALKGNDYVTTQGLLEHRLAVNSDTASDLVKCWLALKDQTGSVRSQTIGKMTKLIGEIEATDVVTLLRKHLPKS